MDEIYLDYNATTPCDPDVLAAMLPYLKELFGNPSSRQHKSGRAAFLALEQARKDIAQGIGARSSTEIIFTSGASEANNFLIKGMASTLCDQGRHIISQATEHPAVLQPLRSLNAQGFDVELLGVNSDGVIDLEALSKAIRPDTILLSIMAANNETGVLQPISDIAEILSKTKIHFHCDAAQALGKLPVNVQSLKVDSMSFSAHKCYGPKGMGALFLRRESTRPQPLIEGGGQENGLRSGTSNVPGAVGMAKAVRMAGNRVVEDSGRIQGIRDLFEIQIRDMDLRSRVNGLGAPRLPNTSNISFHGIDGQALTASLSGFALSTGSACASSLEEISHVLKAMGLSPRNAGATLRISFGRHSTREDALQAAKKISSEVRRLRGNKRRR